jgi:hypothetical protein
MFPQNRSGRPGPGGSRGARNRASHGGTRKRRNFRSLRCESLEDRRLLTITVDTFTAAAVGSGSGVAAASAASLPLYSVPRRQCAPTPRPRLLSTRGG